MLPRPRKNGPTAALACLFLVLAAAACGSEDSADSAAARPATLVLDFVPGPVHAGIYRALAAGYYSDEGIDLEIIEPTSTADTLKLIDAGEAELGIADGIDVATQIDAGRDAIGVLAIAQRPLGGVIALAESGIDEPADLEGRLVGLTGVPSDEAILDAIVAGDGGDPAAAETVTIGFNGVADLEAGKIDAFTGFIPADGVQAETDGFPTVSFAPDRYAGLRYPGLVAFSTTEEVEADPDLMSGFTAATRRGYEDVLADPDVGLDALLDANPAIPDDFARASLDAYLPYLTAAGRPFGTFDDGELEGLSDFLLEAGLIEGAIPPDRYATDAFAGE